MHIGLVLWANGVLDDQHLDLIRAFSLVAPPLPLPDQFAPRQILESTVWLTFSDLEIYMIFEPEFMSSKVRF